MTKTIYHESCMAATSEVEQTESGFNVERVFVNLSFISRRTLVPVSDSPLHTSHFCFFACSVRKWKYKSLQSHMSGPPPNTELKILAGLPVITGRHIYLKGVVRPPPHRHRLYTPRQNIVWTHSPVTSEFQHSSHS